MRKVWPRAELDRRGDWSWDYPDWTMREDKHHAYRGVTSEEFAAILRTGHVQSTQAYSVPGEGTSFARDAATALSYVQVGRDNPARTNRPIYVLEVVRSEKLIGRRGYDYLVAHEPIPLSDVTRIWRFQPDGSVEDLDQAGLP